MDVVVSCEIHYPILHNVYTSSRLYVVLPPNINIHDINVHTKSLRTLSAFDFK
jgi:hypothetical protein